jgi:hypothetical protein
MDTDDSHFYFCLKHRRVEPASSACAERFRLGPYDSESEAAQALERVKERNEVWDAEDERWERGR